MDYSNKEKIEKIRIEKEAAIAASNFEKAAKLRDEENRLNKLSGKGLEKQSVIDAGKKGMRKKRSKGVTFWGWVFIVASIIGLLQLINFQWQIKTYGIGLLFFSVITTLAYLVCGICLLKLKENARKAAIILGIISILSIPAYIKPALNAADFKEYEKYHYTKSEQRIVEQMKPEYQQKALENLQKSKDAVKKALPVIFIIIFGVPILIFELIPIYFFTRPKVKEQFRQL